MPACRSGTVREMADERARQVAAVTLFRAMAAAEGALGELERWRLGGFANERLERATRSRLLRAVQRAVRATERAAQQAAPFAFALDGGYEQLRELAGALGSARRQLAAGGDPVDLGAQAEEVLGALERSFRIIGELLGGRGSAHLRDES